MGSDYPFTKLKDICVKITKGSTPTKKDGGFTERGVNFIKAESASYDGVLNESKFTFVTAEIYAKYKRSQLEENDILFSMAGAFLGKTGFVEKKHLPANTNQALALIRVDITLANPKFVLYCLQQKRVVHFVNSSISQSAQPNINLQQIGDLVIDFPERKVQDSIVNILDSIDQRSLINRQSNQTLEQMAQTLFKCWFVDFDPVIDNALAAGNAIPDELKHRVEIRKKAYTLQKQNPNIKPLPVATQRLFPSEFEHCDDNTLGIQGWIPKGWEVKDIKSLSFKLTKGTTATKKQIADSCSEVLVPFLKVRDLTDNNEIKFDGLDSIPLDVHENQLKRSILHSGDILISIAGTIGRIALVPTNLNNCNCNQALAFIRCNQISVRNFVYHSLQINSMQSYFESKVVQAVQANLSLGSVGEIDLIVPDNSLLDIWNSQTETILSKLELSRNQKLELEKIRDVLLPKLISGEIKLGSSTQELMNA